jgi:site-specific recombinase XerD
MIVSTDDTGQLALLDDSDAGEIATKLERLDEASRRFAASAKSPATLRAYRADWNHFWSWCEEHGATPLPTHPDVLRLYVTEMAEEDYSTATISRRISTIRQAHAAAREEDPTVDARLIETLKGIRRELGIAPQQKDALVLEDVRAMCRTLPDDMKGIRDRALLLVGWVGAFRRSELVELNVADVKFRHSFAVVHVRKSKSDQEGKGAWKKITAGSNALSCPVRALRAWLDGAQIERGPLFRAVDRWANVADTRLSTISVNRVVKAAGRAIGLDPENLGSHSLRRGHITQAARQGCPKRTIRNQSGHASDKMIDWYTELEDIVKESSADWLGH